MTTLTVVNDRPEFTISSNRPSLQPVDARPRFAVSLNGVRLLTPTRTSPALTVTCPARVSFAPQGGSRVLIARPQRGPQGEPGSNSDVVFGEQLAGAINGSNATFTTEHEFVPGQLVVRVNGLAQRLVTDFQTVGSDTIVFGESPQPGDYLAADYERA